MKIETQIVSERKHQNIIYKSCKKITQCCFVRVSCLHEKYKSNIYNLYNNRNNISYLNKHNISKYITYIKSISILLLKSSIYQFGFLYIKDTIIFL